MAEQLLHEDVEKQIVLITSDTPGPSDPGGWSSVQTRWKPNSSGANEADVKQRVRTALAANSTFLGIATPTAAQNAAQIKSLTRQVNALLRLELRELADISDT